MAERRALKLRASERRALKLRAMERRVLKLRANERRVLKLRAVEIALAQIRVIKNGAFEMPPAQDQSMLDDTELFRIVDLCGFEHIKTRKHERVRKNAPAPPSHIVHLAIEQEIVERGPFWLILPSFAPSQA